MKTIIRLLCKNNIKSFVTVRTNLRKAKKRQTEYADRGTKAVEVGDSVFYKNNQRKGKLDSIMLSFVVGV